MDIIPESDDIPVAVSNVFIPLNNNKVSAILSNNELINFTSIISENNLNNALSELNHSIPSFKENLINWATDCNVPHSTLNALLKVLKNKKLLKLKICLKIVEHFYKLHNYLFQV